MDIGFKKKNIMKITAILILFFAPSFVFAQTEKGSTLVGGAFSLQTTKNNSSFSLTPNVGYFPIASFAVGAGLNLDFSKQGDLKNNQVGIGPYVRYYFGKTSTKPFLVSEGSFLSSTYESRDVTGTKVKTTTNGVGFMFGLGFAAFVNDIVAVEGLTGYNYSDFKGSNGSSGFTMRLGFQLYFNRKSITDLKTNVLGQ